MNDVRATEEEYDDLQLPRWVQVPAGILLELFTLLCLAGSLMMLLLPNEKAPILAPALGAVWTVTCGCMLRVCTRLITGRRNRGELLAPGTLRIVGWLFLALPIGGLFTGYFVTYTVVAIIQTAAYISIFLGLRRLAAYREANEA